MLGLTQCPPFPSLPLHSLPQVDAFYNFWYSFKSWREFPHPDEEDIEQVRQRSLPPALPCRRAALLLVAPASPRLLALLLLSCGRCFCLLQLLWRQPAIFCWLHCRRPTHPFTHAPLTTRSPAHPPCRRSLGTTGAGLSASTTSCGRRARRMSSGASESSWSRRSGRTRGGCGLHHCTALCCRLAVLPTESSPRWLCRWCSPGIACCWCPKACSQCLGPAKEIFSFLAPTDFALHVSLPALQRDAAQGGGAA